MTELPTADELRDLATRALTRCGVDVAALKGDATSRTPVLGTDLLPVPWPAPTTSTGPSRRRTRRSSPGG